MAIECGEPVQKKEADKKHCESVSLSVQPRDHLLQVADHSLPAVACALVETPVFRSEARLLHAHKRAGLRRRQRPRDDSPRSRRCLFGRSVPAMERIISLKL